MGIDLGKVSAGRPGFGKAAICAIDEPHTGCPSRRWLSSPYLSASVSPRPVAGDCGAGERLPVQPDGATSC